MMASAERNRSRRSRRDLADDAHRQTGAGERLTPDDLLGQAQFLADGSDLVLEQVAQRLDELEFHVVGQAAHVVVGLDRCGGSGAGLDDIGIERALDEKRGITNRRRRLLEHPDEGLPDDLSLPLRVGDPGELLEKPVGRLDMHEVDIEVRAEGLLHLIRLPGTEQTVVDEDAGESVADRSGDYRRRHRRVDAAGEAADDPALAYLGADRLDLGLDDRV